jgi:SAM-dependent methyltransferase
MCARQQLACATMNGPALREFYDREYHFGEDIDRPNPDRLWRALRELEPLGDTTLLDVGCGVGWATRLAADRGRVRAAVGLDFSRTALVMAARPTTAADVTGSAGVRSAAPVWVCGDGTALPFPDATFDRAFSFGSMEHFPNVAAGFAELARVLRPGGLAVTVVPNFYVRTAQPMEHRDTARGWRRLIEGAGLHVMRVRTDPGPAVFKNRRPGRIALRLGLRGLGLIPALRYQFIFVLRRP